MNVSTYVYHRNVAIAIIPAISAIHATMAVDPAQVIPRWETVT